MVVATEIMMDPRLEYEEPVARFHSLHCKFPFSSSNVPLDRKQKLMARGIMIALCVVFLAAPGKYGPALIHLLFHNFDFHLFTMAFVKKFYPDTAVTLLAWKSCGHTGDVTPFQSHIITYLGAQVRVFVSLLLKSDLQLAWVNGQSNSQAT